MKIKLRTPTFRKAPKYVPPVKSCESCMKSVISTKGVPYIAFKWDSVYLCREFNTDIDIDSMFYTIGLNGFDLFPKDCRDLYNPNNNCMYWSKKQES